MCFGSAPKTPAVTPIPPPPPPPSTNAQAAPVTSASAPDSATRKRGGSYQSYRRDLTIPSNFGGDLNIPG